MTDRRKRSRPRFRLSGLPIPEEEPTFAGIPYSHFETDCSPYAGKVRWSEAAQEREDAEIARLKAMLDEGEASE